MSSEEIGFRFGRNQIQFERNSQKVRSKVRSKTTQNDTDHTTTWTRIKEIPQGS